MTKITISKIPGLGDYGVFVDGLDLQNIDLEEWKSVYGDLHLRSFVTIFRNTKVDATRFGRLVSSFGRSNGMSPYAFFKKYNAKIDASLPRQEAIAKILEQMTKGEINIDPQDHQFIKDVNNIQVPGIPANVHRVSGQLNEKGEPIGVFATGELAWHCNESGHLCFTPGVALMTVQNVGGTATSFSCSVPWYERQSEAFRSELDQLICIHEHVPGKLTPGATNREDYTTKYNFCPVVNHIPLVIKSPIGIKGLHFSYATVTGFKDMRKAESDRLLAKINSELLADSNVYDHWYNDDRPDVLFFENSVTQHRRIGDVTHRLLYRCTTSYCDLLPYQYQPYFQQEYKNKLRELIADVENVMQVKFKPFAPGD